MLSAKVLVVDDNANFLSVIKDFLKDCGYEVMTATNGDQALLVLEQQTPDVIVCDVMMPGIDGIQLQNLIRARIDWADIPFIFLSALSTPEEIRRGKENGCDDYLAKPFNPDELASVIKGKVHAAKRRKTLGEEKMELYRRRIIHTLSHEFRTPLVAINTGTELLLETHRDLDAQRVKHLLESVYRGGKRLQRLVNDFMTLQQIDSGSTEKAQKNLQRICSFVRIVESSLEYLRENNQNSPPIDCSTQFPSEDPIPILVYDVHLVDVVCRLLSNAQKFGAKDKPFQVRLEVNNNHAQLHIRDFGPGLPSQLFSEAQKTFIQINREKLEQQGCGLGLTIASYLIALNGGQLSFLTPTDGQPGLEVVVTFPLAS